MLQVQAPRNNTRRVQLRTRPARAGSIGIVQRHYAHFDTPLPLRSGATLPEFTLASETYGTLNTDRSNAILICHALSGDAHVAGYHTDDPNEKPGWWDDAVGSGKLFDTDRYFVICSNVIGGCQGSTGPASPAPDGKPYALRFPLITVADMVQAQRHLLDRLGIQCLYAVAGGSMGGMQALQWAVDFPDRVAHVLFLASTPRTSTQQIAFNETGRQAIYADPNWKGGNYYGGPVPSGGLAVARMVAHITYMSETSMEHKFGRDLQAAETVPYTLEQPEFTVESYLAYQGRKFVERFDANSYLYITKAIDYFDIGADHGSLQAAVAKTKAAFLVVTFSSDWLYPAPQGQELVQALRAAGRPVEYTHIDAPFGHDSFLVEVDRMEEVVGGYLTRQWPSYVPRC
jgi:homoserine O-acetyltransferase/O-succinyltransferase